MKGCMRFPHSALNWCGRSGDPRTDVYSETGIQSGSPRGSVACYAKKQNPKDGGQSGPRPKKGQKRGKPHKRPFFPSDIWEVVQTAKQQGMTEERAMELGLSLLKKRKDDPSKTPSKGKQAQSRSIKAKDPKGRKRNQPVVAEGAPAKAPKAPRAVTKTAEQAVTHSGNERVGKSLPSPGGKTPEPRSFVTMSFDGAPVSLPINRMNQAEHRDPLSVDLAFVPKDRLVSI